MIDLKRIRENPKEFDRVLALRGLSPLSPKILELDQKHRQALTLLQQKQSERNASSKEIGALKQKGQDATSLMESVENLKKEMIALEEEATSFEQGLHEIMSAIPNWINEKTPEGKGEEDNIIVRTYETPKTFDFQPLSHDDLGEALGLMDFERASKLSGSRFVVLYGALARLERALAQFMLDIHTNEFGYRETQVPLMVQDAAAYGTGQLPKLKEDMFQTTHGFWLIPTSEVALTNLVAQEILDLKKLPLRFTAYTPCFRSEAGAAGRDTRGMIRNHQFTKVELVSITTPDQSRQELERMTSAAETILQRLKLPYRVMALCSKDIGFCAEQTYDLEVWMPSQNKYREISSCSLCGDFQARRMNARYRGEDGKPAFVHTLNGSGLAVGRALVAVLENYQEKDKSVTIPEVLIPYMGGITKITSEGF